MKDLSWRLPNPLMQEVLEAVPQWRVLLHRAIGRSMWRSIERRFRIMPRGTDCIDGDAVPILMLNHKCDDDPVILVSALQSRPAFLPYLHCVAYVMGEHVFQPGFLGAYVVKNPAWLSRLLFRTSLAKIMAWFEVQPMVHARSRYLISHLLEIKRLRGDITLGEVFRGPVSDYLPGATPEMRISSVLHFRNRDPLYKAYDFPIFQPPLEEQLWNEQQVRITGLVSTLASLADCGRMLLIAPQGMFTRNGVPERIRSGLFQVINAMQARPSFVPVNLTYDRMVTGRIPVYVTIGKTIAAPAAQSRDTFNASVSNLLHRDAPVVFSQIAAQYLRQTAERGYNAIGLTPLRESIVAVATALNEQGYAIVPAPNDAEAFEARWQLFLAYCSRTYPFTVTKTELKFDPKTILDQSIQPNGFAHVWVYSYNELVARLACPHGDYG